MAFVYQVVVKVEDEGVPAKSNVSILNLVVKSNFNTPAFLDNYSRTVTETFNITESLFNVTAVDNDLVSIYCYTHTHISYTQTNTSQLLSIQCYQIEEALFHCQLLNVCQ